MAPPGHGGGRIHVHRRITDDATPIIGADLDLGDYKQVTHETFSRQLDIGTRKDYRRRIQRIIDFWKKQCPEYINAGGVLDVSAEDQQDETNASVVVSLFTWMSPPNLAWFDWIERTWCNHW